MWDDTSFDTTSFSTTSFDFGAGSPTPSPLSDSIDMLRVKRHRTASKGGK